MILGSPVSAQGMVSMTAIEFRFALRVRAPSGEPMSSIRLRATISKASLLLVTPCPLALVPSTRNTSSNSGSLRVSVPIIG
ncbi:hypothetical protein HRbin16_00965 [bacterium HR16]|nr:hypothetical protein HRbin16_00965 [bacterium HR16]